MVLKANKNTALFVRITIWMMCMDLLCIEVFRYPSENVSNHSIPFDSIHSWRSIKMYKSIIESIRRKYWLFLSQVGGRIWSTNINSHGALHEGAEKLQFMPVLFFNTVGFMTSGRRNATNNFQLHANTNPRYRCNENAKKRTKDLDDIFLCAMLTPTSQMTAFIFRFMETLTTQRYSRFHDGDLRLWLKFDLCVFIENASV